MGIRSEKNYEDAVARWKKKGDQEYAKAKNGEGGYHYQNAKKCYDNMKRNKQKLNDNYGD